MADRTHFVRFSAFISILSLVAVLAFGGGVLAERHLFTAQPAPVAVATPVAASDAPVFSRFDEVQGLVADEFYGVPADPTAQATFWAGVEVESIDGMTSGLDAYSAYLPPEEKAEFDARMDGEFEGIGIWVSEKEGTLTIVAPIPESPAERAGLRAGDVILSVDGESLEGKSEDEALDLIRGPEGTEVTLTVSRTGAKEPMEFTVERQKIPVPAVIYAMVEGTTVAHIQVTIFGDRTTEQLDRALQRAIADGATGIVLDLRNNGGGWVTSAQETIGRFVPASKGPALLEDEDPSREGDEREEPIIPGSVQVFDLPVVVMVNEGTASASEIVAGALRDYGRADLVGVTTFGKGSVQRVHQFSDGASLKLTFAHWLTPAHTEIDGVGLAPDLEVEPGDGPEDAQLQAAVDLLTGAGG